MKKRWFFAFFLGIILAGAVMFAGLFEFSGTKRQKQDNFIVLRGENVFQVADNLKTEGYIESKISFMIEAIASKNFRKLKAGKYDLSDLNQGQIIEKLSRGEVVPLVISVIPGWTINDIGKNLQSKSIAKKTDFLSYTLFSGENSSLNLAELKKQFSFLEDMPDGASLEGYLYPDTYQIAANAKIPQIASRMLENFDKKVPSDLKAEIKRQKKTIFEVVTMASMLEKEVKTKTDKKIVAGILWKRKEWGMTLDVDSTLLYFLASGHPSFDDKNVKSPYNTYKYGGLPKGPICNPAIESIEAAVYPEVSSYWFYLSAKDGTTIFSRDYGEHLINKAKYLSD